MLDNIFCDLIDALYVQTKSDPLINNLLLMSVRQTT